MTIQQPHLIQKLVSLGNDPDGLFVKQEQYIPDEFIAKLKREREDSISTPAGEMHRVASIPTAWADEWLAEGFDVNREPIKDILKRLRQKQLDAFITSNKV